MLYGNMGNSSPDIKKWPLDPDTLKTGVFIVH